MTPADIIYQRRCHVIERAAVVGVSGACREAGVSRPSYYRWRDRAARYGLSALLPKGRRRPVVRARCPHTKRRSVLAEAIARPTLGARRLLEHLEERGIRRSASGVQKVLRRHNVGTRRQRVAALAALTAADTGLVAPRATEPFGFCLWASPSGRSGRLGRLLRGQAQRDRGPSTSSPPSTPPPGGPSVRWWSVTSPVRSWEPSSTTWPRSFGPSERCSLASSPTMDRSSGPRPSAQVLAELEVTHHRIPPRYPNHNAVVERFHGTVLQECYRPAFHRRRYDRLVDLDALLQDWLGRYNHRWRNHGDYMRGRTPKQLLEVVG